MKKETGPTASGKGGKSMAPDREPSTGGPVGGLGLKKLETSTIRESVTDRLRDALMSGHFGPGQPLTYRGLAAELGTSVMPVREALARLAAAQVLDFLPNRSIRVPRLDARKLDELWKARLLIEGEVAGWAAHMISEGDLRYLDDVQGEATELMLKGEYDESLRLNREFYFTVYRSTGSDLMLNLIETLWMLAGPHYKTPLIRCLVDDPNLSRESRDYRNKIVTALRDRSERKTKELRQADLLHLKMIISGYVASSTPGTDAPED